jgi:hypothetical protein
VNRSGKKYRIFLAAWAIAALFLCIGSLIHFHQWKIYHKALISEVVVSKREQDALIKVQPANNNPVTAGPARISEIMSLPLCSAVRTSITIPDLRTGDLYCLANSGLRAPPLA